MLFLFGERLRAFVTRERAWPEFGKQLSVRGNNLPRAAEVFRDPGTLGGNALNVMEIVQHSAFPSRAVGSAIGLEIVAIFYS